ncbi:MULTISPECIES: polysaccharide deacetylase family protein [Olivibacter]|uniref:Polysaccharide deacetylase family protein n=2 Tax=Olivibacter TaxID=376469 RepID=A0ABV6HJP0_9SPHI|nr:MULTISPECIES: polysaccharide deacetylase family protein [Olivibacter]MCL4639356.1 polysaccharide deacetylase family protein [Olivibacter sp. UJ_SKK_5.1]MDM8175113.1 polysaccharide deacetylase family protein [Olivibacter sp. 47]MDX3913205.1 polysaccharide deacetylase family protein [Pseudosphingobacterium sp.]
MDRYGAIVRGDCSRKEIALIFSADEFSEGATTILRQLQQQNIKASFFLTGRFLDNPINEPLILKMLEDQHYIGAHSDQHLLYCDWTNRDSLLIDRRTFDQDLSKVYYKLKRFGIDKTKAPLFLPPYEWYNKEISEWTSNHGLQLINFTPGTLTTADYTTPDMGKRYRSSEVIYESVLSFMKQDIHELKGFIMLIHLGVGPHRKDKFYNRLPSLINTLLDNGYRFERIDELLK